MRYIPCWRLEDLDYRNPRVAKKLIGKNNYLNVASSKDDSAHQLEIGIFEDGSESESSE